MDEDQITNIFKDEGMMKKEQKELDKKRRGTKGGEVNESKKFILQAAAANRQIAVAESKNMIDFCNQPRRPAVYHFQPYYLIESYSKHRFVQCNIRPVRS